MKTWGIIVGIILVLAFVCSPVFAISKSDLISYYRTLPVSPVRPDTTPDSSKNHDSHFPSFPIISPNSSKWTLPFRLPDLYLKPNYSYTPYDYQTIIFTDSTSMSEKPNIYLYSDRDLVARVRLAPEWSITVSNPVYQTGVGWAAEIRDGSLNGNGDFLFYESVVPDSVWQKDEGYVIRAEYRSEDMVSMLGPYGFNEKENAEFIEYWASHLIENVDYAFYPQETGAVDRVMPLYVSPKPDEVSRIWFYAEPLVSVPGQVTSPEKIVREGFYVVEWGVVIRDEYRI